MSRIERKQLPMNVWRYVLPYAAVLAAIGCAVNRDTGESQLIVLKEKQEISLGVEAEPKFLAEYGGEVDAPLIIQYVNNIGLTLARKSSRTLLPWAFHVVDSEVINAFALPGGKVFISRGLLASLENEAQLAGVLGHEVGHVAARHANDAMARNMTFQIGLAALGVASQQNQGAWLRVLGVGAKQGGTVFLLHFSRKQEFQSDLLGTRYMYEAGYNPTAFLKVLRILQHASSGTGRILELLSTHPLPDSRLKELEAHLRKTYQQAYESTDGYFQSRFESTVLATLTQLPPPRHRKPTQ